MPSGFDVILDVIGGEEVDRNLDAVALKGRILQVGMMAAGPSQVNIGKLMPKRASLIGTVLRARPIEEKIALTRRFAAEMLPLFETGDARAGHRLPLPARPDRRRPRRMESNANVGKILIEVAQAR